MGIKFPTPWKTLIIKFPPPRDVKGVKCPGYARGGGGMLKLRFARYIIERKLWVFLGNFFKMINKAKLTGKLRKNTTAIHVCKTTIFCFQGRNIYCQGSYFHAAFTVYSFIKTNVGRNATQYVALKVTPPSFFGGGGTILL